MSDDQAAIQMGCPFWYLAKFQGDRGPRSASGSDAAADRLQALQEDLRDPACFELIVGGDGFPTTVWRR